MLTILLCMSLGKNLMEGEWGGGCGGNWSCIVHSSSVELLLGLFSLC